MVNPKVPAKSVQELVSYAKTNSGNNAAMVKAIAKLNVQERFEKLSAVGEKMTPEHFGAFIRPEVEGRALVIKTFPVQQ